MADQGRAVAVDAQGALFLAGEFDDTLVVGTQTLVSAGGSDVFVAKRSTAGAPIWAVRAGGPMQDSVFALAATPDGSVLVAGQRSDSDTQTASLSKYSRDGELLWSRQFGTNAGARGVAVDGTGNVYLLGELRSAATFDAISLPLSESAFLAKLTPQGEVLWAQRIEGHVTRGLAVDPEGDVFAAVDGSKLVVHRFSAAGDKRWQSVAGDASDTPGGALAIDGNGGVILASAELRADCGGCTVDPYDVRVQAFTAAGVPSWRVTLASSVGVVSATAASLDSRGHLLVAGYSMGALTVGTEAFPKTEYAAGFLVRISPQGGVEATHQLIASGHCYSQGLPAGASWRC